MPATQRASKPKQAERETGPTASRPRIPAGYGVPKHNTGLLPWSHVTERMTQTMHYWVCTVSPGNRPHATPVDGLWLDDRLYFGGSVQTRRNRNLAANPAVCVHLENGMDVVILHGEAHELRAPRGLAIRLSQASAQKYGYGPKPEEYEKGDGVFVFSPRVVFAWKQFPTDVTRWRFPNDG
jgi:nitroimidazol reductase NimA-like FMN-containing flavoprotein (pyridoxamine 5'-phosphate oxidase superfamily)